jgi:hypothetical protein
MEHAVEETRDHDRPRQAGRRWLSRSTRGEAGVRALDLNGYARVDLRVDEDERIYVLEANPNPNMAYGEDFTESAEASGSATNGCWNGSSRSAGAGNRLER